MGNIPLFLCSLLILCFTLLYFKKRGWDLDVIDVYIIFVALHFGLYPFIRSLYSGKGWLYDSAHNNPWVIGLVFLQALIVIAIIRFVSQYFPEKIKKYLKIKTLIEQWAKVNNVLILALFCSLILFQIVSYYKYGIKAHIIPEDFEKIKNDIPYWLTSFRTIYNIIVFSVFIAAASKAAMSKNRDRYFWITLIIILLPLVAYFGRKAFANIVVIGGIIWMVKTEKQIVKLKYLSIAALMMLSFFIVSNMYQTYRLNLQEVGTSFKLENPLRAALNFNATLKNLKERPGTWEFNYLVITKQMSAPGKVTTNGRIYMEGFKSVIPRLFWPDKKTRMAAEVLADAYRVKLDDVSIAINPFGIAQAEFGYFSVIILPSAVLLIITLMAFLLKITTDYPVFFWLFSVTVLNYFIYVEENFYELFFMLRGVIAIMALFLLYVLMSKTRLHLRAKSYAT
jgi:hypothetical protein